MYIYIPTTFVYRLILYYPLSEIDYVTKKTGDADLQYMLTGKENTSCNEIIVRDTE